MAELLEGFPIHLAESSLLKMVDGQPNEFRST